MVVLQTILLLIIVYYLAKFMLKWLAPKLFGYAMKKAEQKFGGPFGSYQDQASPSSTEGETSIHTAPKRKANPGKKVGEYIDFEEID